jgi:hypothetical protein
MELSKVLQRRTPSCQGCLHTTLLIFGRGPCAHTSTQNHGQSRYSDLLWPFKTCRTGPLQRSPVARVGPTRTFKPRYPPFAGRRIYTRLVIPRYTIGIACSHLLATTLNTISLPLHSSSWTLLISIARSSSPVRKQFLPVSRKLCS